MPDFFDWVRQFEAPDTFKMGGNKPSFDPSGAGTRYAQVALGYELQAVLGATEGSRNHQLNTSAFAMGQLVGGGQIPEATVRTALAGAAHGIGLSDIEVARTLDSGIRAGMAQPRAPQDPYEDTTAGTGAPAATEWLDAPEGPSEAAASPVLAMVLALETAEEPEEDTWAAIDLAPFLDGSYTPPEPTFMQRADGWCLLYPGLVHSLHGESESLKSWVAQAEVVQVLMAGRRALYVDFESDAGQVINRLLLMGCPPELIKENLDYVRPQALPLLGVEQGWARMLATKYAVAVLDGVTESLGLFGKTTKDNDEIAWWMNKVPKRIARWTGAALILIDHVTKSSEDRGRFAIGGQHKMNAVDGAAYTVEVIEPAGVGMVGKASIRIAKDRPGQVRAHCGEYRASDRTQEAAVFVLDSTRPGTVGAFLETYPSNEQRRDMQDEKQRLFMEKVSMLLEQQPDLGKTAIWNQLAGTDRGGAVKEHWSPALAALVMGGWVHARSVGGNKTAHRVVTPYRRVLDPQSRVHAPTTEFEETA